MSHLIASNSTNNHTPINPGFTPKKEDSTFFKRLTLLLNKIFNFFRHLFSQTKPATSNGINAEIPKINAEIPQTPIPKENPLSLPIPQVESTEILNSTIKTKKPQQREKREGQETFIIKTKVETLNQSTLNPLVSQQEESNPLPESNKIPDPTIEIQQPIIEAQVEIPDQSTLNPLVSQQEESNPLPESNKIPGPTIEEELQELENLFTEISDEEYIASEIDNALKTPIYKSNTIDYDLYFSTLITQYDNEKKSYLLHDASEDTKNTAFERLNIISKEINHLVTILHKKSSLFFSVASFKNQIIAFEACNINFLKKVFPPVCGGSKITPSN